jgi:hypothetical protein
MAMIGTLCRRAKELGIGDAEEPHEHIALVRGGCAHGALDLTQRDGREAQEVGELALADAALDAQALDLIGDAGFRPKAAA